ncbi:MAG: hypothetical protein AAGI68_03225 [Planctomycetota bacterium]
MSECIYTTDDGAVRVSDDVAGLRLLIERGYVGEAWGMIERMEDAGGLSDEAWELGMGLALGQGDLARAEAWASARVDERGDATGCRWQGSVCLQRAEVVRAGWWYWRAVRRDTMDVAGWAGLWTCASLAGRTRLAERAMATLRSVAPAGERASALASVWVKAAAYHAVRSYLTAQSGARERSPMAGLLRTASEALQAEADRRPRRADTQHHLAVCTAALGERDRAAVANAMALRVNPGYAAAQQMALRLGA